MVYFCENGSSPGVRILAKIESSSCFCFRQQTGYIYRTTQKTWSFGIYIVVIPIIVPIPGKYYLLSLLFALKIESVPWEPLFISEMHVHVHALKCLWYAWCSCDFLLKLILHTVYYMEVQWYIDLNPWLWIKGFRVRFRSVRDTFVLQKTLRYPHCCSPPRCINGYPVGCKRYLLLDLACVCLWSGARQECSPLPRELRRCTMSAGLILNPVTRIMIHCKALWVVFHTKNCCKKLKTLSLLWLDVRLMYSFLGLII